MPHYEKETADDAESIAVLHPDFRFGAEVLKRQIGSADPGFVDEFLRELARVANIGTSKPKDAATGERIHFVMSMVRDLEPRDQTEATLALHITATHLLSMMLMERLNQAETIKQQDSASRALNMLMRTHTMQVEAFQRHRNGGVQTIKVEHKRIIEHQHLGTAPAPQPLDSRGSGPNPRQQPKPAATRRGRPPRQRSCG